jgi:hypothetical protein
MMSMEAIQSGSGARTLTEMSDMVEETRVWREEKGRAADPYDTVLSVGDHQGWVSRHWKKTKLRGTTYVLGTVFP